MQSRLIILLLLALPGLAGAAAAADELIRWGGGVSPNMVSAATNLPADPGAVTPRWTVKLGTIQYSIPTLDRGRIYVGANDAGVTRPGYQPSGGGVLLCLDQATGRLIWQAPSPRNKNGVKPPYHFDQWRCGFCSGPVADGDRVYAISGRGEILCLDRDGQANGNDGPCRDELDYWGLTNAVDRRLEATDGDIVWRYDLLTGVDVAPHDVCGSTLLVVGDLLYACTSNGQDSQHEKMPRPLAPTLIALDKHTGRLVARDDERIGLRCLHANWSSPLAGRVNGRLLVFFGGGDGILYAFEPPAAGSAGVQTLKKVWQTDANPPDYRLRDGRPVPYSKYNANAPDGPSEIIGTPVLYSNRLDVAIGQSPLHGTGQGCLSCLDAATGTQIWSSRLVDRSLATPAVAAGLLYIPDFTGRLHCFDAATGARCWVHPLGSRDWCSSAFVADGKVYVGTEAAVLWVLKAGREKQVLSRARLSSKPITLTAADGVLYLPTQRSLSAVPGPGAN